MSTLISSAVGGGKKAAPKAVARRRPPPAPPKPTTPVIATETESSIADVSTLPSQSQAEVSEVEAAARLSPSTRPAQLEIADGPSTASAQPPPPVHDSRPKEPRLASQPMEISQTASGRYEEREQDITGEAQAADRSEPQPAAAAASSELVQSSPQPRGSNKRRRTEVTEEEPQQAASKVRKAPKRRNVTDQGDGEEAVTAAAEESAAPQQEAGAERDSGATSTQTTKSKPAARNKRTSSKATPRTKRATRNSTSGEPTTDPNGNATDDNATGTPVSPNTAPDDPQADGGGQQQKSKGRARKPRGRKKKATPADATTTGGEEIANGEENADESDEERPEDHQIDPASLSMYDLSRDKKHGKTSEREKKMAEIDWDEVARKRRDAVDKAIAENKSSSRAVVQSTEGPDQTAESQDVTAAAAAAATAAAPTLPPPGGAGVKFRIVDNQIVVDEATTTIDRQAQAEAEAQISEPVEESTDLTTRINRTTWINDRKRDVADRVPMYKSKSDPWSLEETEKLYEAIAMFGTDYFTIAQMFPPKTRRQIKLKVQREEKIDPARINAAFLGKHTPMSLEFYAQATGREVSDFTKAGNLEEVSSRIAEDMKDKEEAMRAAIAVEAENEKNREAFEKEQARLRSNKKKSKKATGGGTMGGVPVGGTEEMIDDVPDGAD